MASSSSPPPPPPPSGSAASGTTSNSHWRSCSADTPRRAVAQGLPSGAVQVDQGAGLEEHVHVVARRPTGEARRRGFSRWRRAARGSR